MLRLVTQYVDLVTDGELDDRKAKAACELLLLCSELARSPEGKRHAPWLADTLDQLEPRLRGPALLQRLLWLPGRVGMYAMPHGLLRRSGRLDARWDALVGGLFERSFSRSREVYPFEALEQRWCARLSDAHEPAESRPALLTERGGHPLFMGEDDAYAYTHAVLYATDVGAAPLPAERVDEVSEGISAGVLFSLVRGDFDILGEFLLCAVCATPAPSAAVRVGLAVWASVWDELGYLPDRNLASAAADPTLDRRGKVFFGIYHANVVAGLLCIGLLGRLDWLARPSTPPAKLPSGIVAELAGRASGWAGSLAGEVAVSPTASDALRNLSDLPATSHLRALEPLAHELAELAGDLTIHRGMQSRDLELLATGIRTGCAQPHPTGTWLAALEWLLLAHDSLDDLGLYDAAGGPDVRSGIEATLADAVAAGRRWGLVD